MKRLLRKRKMIRFILICIFCVSFSNIMAAGEGYKAAVLCGKYGQGAKDWQDAHDKWLNGTDSEPLPEGLREVDGHGYHDGCDAACGS